MDLDFTPFFSTKAQAKDFTNGLSAVIDGIYRTDFELEKSLSTQFGINKKDKLISLIKENKISADSVSELKIFFENLIEKIQNLPVLSLTIPFEPDDSNLSIFSEWFLINLKKQVLLDIKVDRSLIGGASLSYKGSFKNFSVKPQVEKIIQDLEQKTAISENKKELNPKNPEVPHIDQSHLHIGR